MLPVLLGLLITVECVFASPFSQEVQRVKRQSLQETFQSLQNLQQQQSQAQQGSPRPQGSNRPGGTLGQGYPSDPNFGSIGGLGNQRPSGSGSGSSDFDAFNGPGFGGGNGGSGGSNNQPRPGSGNNNQGFDVFNGPAAQGSGSNVGRPNGNQQGFGGGNQQGGSRPATTIRSPLNVVSNENTIPEAGCVRNCMTVSTYDPVCGTDDITYTNGAKFRCAQNCGRRVTEAYRGACVTTPSPN